MTLKMFVLYILKTIKHIVLLQMQVTQVCLDYWLQDRTRVLGSFSASLYVGIIHNRLCNSTWGLHLKLGFPNFPSLPMRNYKTASYQRHCLT